MVRGLIARFSPSAAPPMARATYARELLSVGLLSAAVACVTGNVIGVIAKKAFDAGDMVVAMLAAAEAIANITSVVWTRVLHGADRVRATNLLQIGTLLCVVAVACAPYSGVGVLVLLGGTILARSFLTGVISARTDLWRANYPRTQRSVLTGNLTILATFVMSLTAMLIALAMDLDARWLDAVGLGWLDGHAFRPLYVVAAVVGVGGVVSFSTIRWRGRAAHLKAERTGVGEDGSSPASPRAMLRVLQGDEAYRRFMAAQFVLGAPNIAALPIFILALKDHFEVGYTQSIALAHVLPVLVPVLVIPAWARLLDTMHVIRFRAYHSWVFVIANALMAVGFLTQNLWVLYAARIVLGIAFGGGMLAWNLGHHDFAKRELATIYMGIHVTLTGVRGLIAPFVGTLLYSAWTFTLAGQTIRWEGLGAWTFALLALASAAGGVMFVQLYRSTRGTSGLAPGRD